MKKISSIALIAALLLLQANRWTAYMACQVKNLYAAATCDCEKLLTMPDNPPGEHSHDGRYTHWAPDEFFYLPQQAAIAKPATATAYCETPAGRHACGYPLSLIKPPAEQQPS